MVIAYPAKFNERMVPTGIYMECVGDGCPLLGLKGEYVLSYDKCNRERIYGCEGEPLKGYGGIGRYNHYSKCFAYRLLRTH